MTADDWRDAPPDEDDPREVPEPDWDAIRESRRESREDREAERKENDWYAQNEREMQRIELGYALADLIDAGDMDQEF